MHIYVPLEPVYSYDQVRAFAEILSHLVLSERPNLFTTPRSVAKRKKGRGCFGYFPSAPLKTDLGPRGVWFCCVVGMSAVLAGCCAVAKAGFSAVRYVQVRSVPAWAF